MNRTDHTLDNETRFHRLADILDSLAADNARLSSEEREACTFGSELIQDIFEPVVHDPFQ